MRTFLALFVVYLLGPLLDRAPRTIGRLKLQWWLKLLCYYEESCERVRLWHKGELERLDPIYRWQRAQLRYTKACEKAHEEGISPSDPRYPDFGELPTLEKIPRPPNLRKVS